MTNTKHIVAIALTILTISCGAFLIIQAATDNGGNLHEETQSTSSYAITECKDGKKENDNEYVIDIAEEYILVEYSNSSFGRDEKELFVRQGLFVDFMINPTINISESNQQLIDGFLSQFSESGFGSLPNYHVNFSWGNGLEVELNERITTRYGVPVGYYILDLNMNGIPDIMVEFVTYIDGNYHNPAIIFQYHNGEFQPIHMQLYLLTAGTDVSHMSAPGEYTYVFPKRPIFHINANDGRLFMFMNCENLDLQGDWFVELNDGVLNLLEPNVVVRYVYGRG